MRSVFVTCGEGKPQFQLESKINNRERRNSLREKSREAKCVYVKAEPAEAILQPAATEGQGWSHAHPAAPTPAISSAGLSWHFGTLLPLSVVLQGSSRRTSPSLMFSYPPASSSVAGFGALRQQWSPEQVGGFSEPKAPQGTHIPVPHGFLA